MRRFDVDHASPAASAAEDSEAAVADCRAATLEINTSAVVSIGCIAAHNAVDNICIIVPTSNTPSAPLGPVATNRAVADCYRTTNVTIYPTSPIIGCVVADCTIIYNRVAAITINTSSTKFFA